MERYHFVGETRLSTRSKPHTHAAKDSERTAPVTVYPGTRKEHPARVCARCFAKNVSGETFCKVCGDELPTAEIDLDLGATRRVDAPVVNARLVVHEDGAQGGDREFLLDKDIVLVGRASPADNVRPDVDLGAGDPNNFVSRRHAFILRRQGSIVLEDLESVNGTYINLTLQAAPHVMTPLRDGDEITFGQTRCTIRIGNAKPS